MIMALLFAAAINMEVLTSDCGAGLFLPNVGGYWVEFSECRKEKQNV